MSLSIGKNAVRKMALLLLDDENGINLEAYSYLSAMLVETGNDDILDAVDVTENRAYVGEDYAEEEFSKIVITEAPDTVEEECSDCGTHCKAETCSDCLTEEENE